VKPTCRCGKPMHEADGVIPVWRGDCGCEIPRGVPASPRRVVMFSGGAGSWATAKRVAEHHGTDDLTLLFADTLIEDEDLYRFLKDAAANVGGRLEVVKEGRDPWQVFFDVRFLGNTRIDPCSRVLKREFLRRWLDANCDPASTVVYLGIGWDESHRFDRAKGYWHPWTVEAPMCDPPYMDKTDVLTWMEREGVTPPRLYGMGFHHNNCGGFCVKGGQAQFATLLREMPERYAYHERKEQELRDHLDADVAIMKDRRGGTTKPLTMRAFRERLEQQPSLFDEDEWGACGCFDTLDEAA
jgi:3'-phosphoadenosine 5'-phosphosulfate sulfotransferase (PAPS reductase)/FAD synthetase